MVSKIESKLQRKQRHRDWKLEWASNKFIKVLRKECKSIFEDGTGKMKGHQGKVLN